MYILNPKQQQVLDHYTDVAKRERLKLLKRLQERLTEPAGAVARDLSWSAESIMQMDAELAFFNQATDALNGAGNAATLQSVTNYFRRELRNWSPGRSSSASDNLCKDAQFNALKSVVERLETMLELAS